MSASSVFGAIDKNTYKFTLPRLDIWANDNNIIVEQKIKGYWNWINYINSIKRIYGN